MVHHSLSPKGARRIIISSQMLSNSRTKRDKKYLLNIIETLGYVQIDTISVVERSHHHILWARMNSYKKSMLDELVKDKLIFEYWSHAAAYLPMRDFRFSLIRKKVYSEKHSRWGKANKKIMNYVYERIMNEGPLQSKDFENETRCNKGWWDWKPSKDALDFLFHQGRLMIESRKGFQKVYELTERVLPNNIDTSFPTDSEFYEHLIFNSINSLGLVSAKEITYLRRYDRAEFKNTLNKLIEEKKIVRTRIKNFDSEYLTTESKLSLLDTPKKKSSIHILSPFDNLVIQRKRLKDFFGFDYTIECYVPEAKRKFGYYVLPVLYGDRFIARIDAKADRADNTFIIKNLFREGRIIADKQLKQMIKKFASFCGCENVSGYLFTEK